MNKNKIKKNLEYQKIKSIFKRSNFVAFFSIQNMSVKDKLFFKEALSDSNFKCKIVKSNLLTKALMVFFLNRDSFISGSLAICYPNGQRTTLESQESFFLEVQRVFKILKKKKETILLGNLYQSSLQNKLFEKEISSLKSLSVTQINTLSLIQEIPTSFLSHLGKSKRDLSLILKKKKED